MTQTLPYGATNHHAATTPEATTSQQGESRGRSHENMQGGVIGHDRFC